MTDKKTIVERVKNAALYSDGTIRVDSVIASYPHLDKMFAGKNASDEDIAKKGAYSVNGLLPKSTHKEAKDLIKRVIEKMQAENDTKVATANWFLSNGDESGKDEEAGHWKISAREKNKPRVRRADRSIVESNAEIKNLIYGGCVISMVIRPWYQDGVKVGVGFGKRINAGLIAVKYEAEGKPFGGGRVTDDDVWDGADSGDDGFDDGDDDL